MVNDMTCLKNFRFEDLPIEIDDTEYRPGGWHRSTTKNGTIADLLETWNIDDPTESCEFAQVLRYLKQAMAELSATPEGGE